MLDVHVLLTEKRLADDFVDSLEHGRLPEKFFYWLPLSVKAWLALCGDGEYRNYSRSYRLVSEHADDLAAALGAGPVQVVSLGAGQGDKDLRILTALRARGREPEYIAVDSSQSLLEIAGGTAFARGFPSRAVKADLGDPEHRERLRSRGGPPRLLLLLGNTLGAFQPLEMAKDLARLLRREDRLLVDGEVFHGEETLAGYDNPINRRFAFAPLASIGVQEEDGELRFQLEQNGGLEGLFLVTKHFEAKRDLTLAVAGATVYLARGERVRMSHSAKYAPGRFAGLLAEAGLEVEWQRGTDDGRFLLTLVRRR